MAMRKKNATPLDKGWRFIILILSDEQLAAIEDPIIRNLATVARDQRVLGAVDDIQVRSDEGFNRKGTSSLMKTYYFVTFGIEDLDMALAWGEDEIEDVTRELQMNEAGRREVQIPIMSDDAVVGHYQLSQTTSRSFSHIEGMTRHVEEAAVPDYPELSWTSEQDDIIGSISLGSHNPRVGAMLRRSVNWNKKG